MNEDSLTGGLVVDLILQAVVACVDGRFSKPSITISFLCPGRSLSGAAGPRGDASSRMQFQGRTKLPVNHSGVSSNSGCLLGRVSLSTPQSRCVPAMWNTSVWTLAVLWTKSRMFATPTWEAEAGLMEHFDGRQ